MCCALYKGKSNMEGKKMKITINPTGINNFHNSPPLTVRITGEGISGFGEHLYKISKRQARKIEQHFCGITDCRCPHGGAVVETSPDGDKFGLRAEK
jgi:hypothetical protein